MDCIHPLLIEWSSFAPIDVQANIELYACILSRNFLDKEPFVGLRSFGVGCTSANETLPPRQ